jgi:hypothetical protein
MLASLQRCVEFSEELVATDRAAFFNGLHRTLDARAFLGTDRARIVMVAGWSSI